MALTKEQIQQIAAQTRSSFESGSFAPTGVQCLFDDVHDAIDTAIRAQHQLMDMSLEERGKLIEAMRDCEKVCNHLHLPLQSGSSRILKLMNRHYDKERYLMLVDKLRAAIPDIALTTDIIVGFPGETEEDFAETMDVVRRVRYDSAFTFIYSKRTGTPAAAMEQVPEAVVKERFDRLLKEVQEISSEVCGRDLHTTQKVLVEMPDDHKEGYVTGRLSNNTVVHFPGDESLIGKIVDVWLEESKGFYYMGKQVEGQES